MAHTTVASRPTGMPSSPARSPLSALARTAVPVAVAAGTARARTRRPGSNDGGDHVVGGEDDRRDGELQRERRIDPRAEHRL